MVIIDGKSTAGNGLGRITPFLDPSAFL